MCAIYSYIISLLGLREDVTQSNLFQQKRKPKKGSERRHSYKLQNNSHENSAGEYDKCSMLELAHHLINYDSRPDETLFFFVELFMKTWVIQFR